MNPDQPTPAPPTLRRFPTQVPGLDDVLGGGLLTGEVLAEIIEEMEPEGENA